MNPLGTGSSIYGFWVHTRGESFMLRPIVCSFAALVLVVGVATAQDKPKGKTVNGTFVSYKEGTLTLKVTAKKGEEPKAVEYKVGDEIKTVTLSADAKKEGTAKDAFKELKEGTAVSIKIGEGD